MIIVHRGLPLAAVMLAMAAATPSQAASPELALAVARGDLARPVDPVLADAFRRSAAVDGPAPISLAARDARPVIFVAAASVVEARPMETTRSREQVAFLGDHRNLYRGPGSLVHAVRNVRPIPAPEQSKPAAAEKRLAAAMVSRTVASRRLR